MNLKPKRIELLGLLIGTLLNMSCRSLPMKDADSFGLPLVEIDVSSEDLAVLNSTVWDKTLVGADVKIAGTQTRADLQYSGKSSLDDFKKNYDIKFRDSDRYLGRQEVRLSSQSVDRSAIRSMLGFWAYMASGLEASSIEPIALYINDDYRGLYFIIEKVDEDFFKSRLLSHGPVYKAIFGNANFGRETLRDPKMAFDVELGDDDYAPMIRITELVLSAEEQSSRIEKLGKIVSVIAMLNYQATTVVMNHFDGFTNNFLFFFDKGQGLYRPLPWDLDRIYERDSEVFIPGTTLWGANNLTQLLLQDPANRKYYLERLLTLLTGELSKDALYSKIEAIKDTIKKAWVNDRVLTAKGRTLDAETAELKDAISEWHQFLLDDVRKELSSLIK